MASAPHHEIEADPITTICVPRDSARESVCSARADGQDLTQICAFVDVLCGRVNGDPPCMQNHRGQSTVEYIAILACAVALFATGALLVRTGLVAGLFAALQATRGGAVDDAASPAAIAFVDQALAPSNGTATPLLQDAIGRLGAEVGPSTARAIALDHALRRYLPIATATRLSPLADPSYALARPAYNGNGASTIRSAWSIETPRSPPVIRLVSLADEQRWSATQQPSNAERAVGLGTAGLASLASAIAPPLAVTMVVLDVVGAAASTPQRGTPAGSREGDIIVCRFVWRTNRATAAWIDQHPVEAVHLQLGERLPTVVLTVHRAGQLLQQSVVRSDATTC